MTITEAFLELHPFIQWSALWLVWPPLLAAYALLTWPMRLINRMIRSRNIREKGWPPPHLDADGDFAEKETNNGT